MLFRSLFRFKSAVFIFGLFILTGCATTAPQTQALLKNLPPVPASQEIPSVPFIEQSTGHCGPATLTMAMQTVGHSITVEALAPRVMTPGQQGSLQEDMIGATRREGLMGVRIRGLVSLLKEIAAGHPVIIFENLGLSWYPQWHYALVFGYDIGKQELILHSGSRAAERIDMRIFERSWKLADYWGLVVLPPGQLAASGDELSHLQAAAGLEQVGHSGPAESAYRSILKRWPKSFGALFGLGNVTFQRAEYKSSVAFLREALKVQPDSTAAQNNLHVVESALKKQRRNSN